jgi:hypothetical protein
MTLKEDIKLIQELKNKRDGLGILYFTDTTSMLNLCANTAPALIARLQKAEELLKRTYHNFLDTDAIYSYTSEQLMVDLKQHLAE